MSHWTALKDSLGDNVDLTVIKEYVYIALPKYLVVWSMAAMLIAQIHHSQCHSIVLRTC